MADIEDPRGKHLLGEAVRLLVQSGVTGAAITDFIQDYSKVVHATLAAPLAAPNDVKEQIKAALKEALQELAPSTGQTVAGLRRQVAVYIDGARTSMSLRKDLLESTTAALGCEKHARRLVEELANAKPAEHLNRSAWVESQLEHRLLLLKTESNLANKLAH